MILKIELQVLEAICNVLADTASGLSGRELERLLEQRDVEFRPATEYPNKRTMLYEALRARQAKDGCANNVFAFVEASMHPTRFTDDIETYSARRDKLNRVLLLIGFKLAENGKIETARVASTLPEAAARANSMRAKLEMMGIHPCVTKYCRRELFVDKNYFHSVLEVTKGVADRLRELSGCTTDGAQLARETLAPGNRPLPLLVINAFQSDTDRSEQDGLCLIARGLFRLYRNPMAHDSKLHRHMSENDAILAFQLASIIHHHLDRAHDTRPVASTLAGSTTR